MRTIRVLLADDHVLVRAGIRALLEDVEGVEVVAEAGDGHEALRLIESHQLDVVLMDIAMPGLNGLEVTERVAKEFPSVRVIILSMYANKEYVWQALHAGAMGYLLKRSKAVEVELAINAAACGEIYLSSGISKYILDDYLKQARGKSGRGENEDSPHRRLTPRQREVLQSVAEGRTTKEIAQMLKISVKTVEAHRAQLMKKVGVHDVAGLVRYAIQKGLVEPER